MQYVRCRMCSLTSCTHVALWEGPASQTQSRILQIIYVVDSSDRDRIAIAKQELCAMLEVRLIDVMCLSLVVRMVCSMLGAKKCVVSGIGVVDVCNARRNWRKQRGVFSNRIGR